MIRRAGRTVTCEAFAGKNHREASRFPGALVIFDVVWWIFKEYIDLEGKKRVEQPFLFLLLSFPYTLILSLLDSGFVVGNGPLWSTARDVLLSSVVMWERNHKLFLHTPHSSDAGLLNIWRHNYAIVYKITWINEVVALKMSCSLELLADLQAMGAMSYSHPPPESLASLRRDNKDT